MKNLRSWGGGLCLLLLAGSFGALRSQEPGMPEVQPSVCRPICPGVGDARPTDDLTEDVLKQTSGNTFITSSGENREKLAWSADHPIFYEAQGSQLWIKPPGKLQAVDFSEVERAEREDMAQALKSMEVLLSKLEKEEGKPRSEEARKALREYVEAVTQSSHKLERLAVSPDGRYLAAIVERSSEVSLPADGVIISLRHQTPVARRFAVNVYHKILWAEHGSRIYFYAQPVVGEGNGTVYQLDFKDF